FSSAKLAPAGARAAESTACVSGGRRSQQRAGGGSWTKYYNQSFSQPGMGGLCQPPVPPPLVKSGITFQSNPDISFNSALRDRACQQAGPHGGTASIYVHTWHKADMPTRSTNVRFRGESRHRWRTPQ